MRCLFACILTVLSWAAAAEGILVFGDSLSAAYGIDRESGWVHLLNERVSRVCPQMPIHNASVSGETTAGGAARLPELLERHAPDIVVLELGGNDGLRGLSTRDMRENLADMIERAQAAGARVLLLGIRIPPNYGPAYTEAFDDAFARLERNTGVDYIPFFLDGVALDPALMQSDGIHPNAAAQPRLLDNIWPALMPLVEAQCDNRPSPDR